MLKAFFLIFGLLAITTPHPGTSGTVYKQHMSLYTTKDCSDEKTPFDKPMKNLSSFTNPFYSAKVNGIGLVYNNPNFNTWSSVIHFPKKTQNLSDYYHDCYKLTILEGKGVVGSLRFAGDISDYRRESLNIYNEVNYRGEVKLVVKDATNGIELSPKSLIITGKSAWTLYEKSDYKGLHHCFIPVPDSKPYEPGLLVSNMPKNMSFNLFWSARKGCK